MARGTVTWFNDTRGYGFIAHPSGENIFVHFSQIVDDGFRTLKEGEEVEFDLKETDRGLQAERVSRH